MSLAHGLPCAKPVDILLKTCGYSDTDRCNYKTLRYLRATSAIASLKLRPVLSRCALRMLMTSGPALNVTRRHTRVRVIGGFMLPLTSTSYAARPCWIPPIHSS